jgi:glycosyltransferase involved in cell wall biosynthesis
MPDPSRIAVIHQGDRPRLNTLLAGMLGDIYPEFDVDDIDVLELVRFSRIRSARAAVSGLTEYALPVARRRMSPKRAIVSSEGFGQAAQALVQERVSPTTHRFTFQSQSLFPAWVAGVPHFVYTDHAHLANLEYPGFDRNELYAASTLVFARSKHVSDAIVHGYGCPSDRVVVVGVGPNTTPPSDVDVDHAIGSWNGGRIVFVGVDWERKGGPDLIAAFRTVQLRHPDARLDIVGCSPIGVEGPGIKIHGRLSLERVADLLAHADLFCLPTLAEPFGVAFIEAMHAGLPLVGTRIGAIPDFLIPRETGLLVEPDNVRGLAHALIQLLANPDETQRMGRAARRLAQERFTWEAVMTSMKHHIDAALLAAQSELA